MNIRKFLHIRYFSLVLIFVPTLVFAGAGTYMGADPNDIYSTSSLGGTNILVGLVLFVVLVGACFLFSVVRATAYIFAVLLTLGGMFGDGNGEILKISIPMLLACIAGTLWDPEEGLLVGKPAPLNQKPKYDDKQEEHNAQSGHQFESMCRAQQESIRTPSTDENTHSEYPNNAKSERRSYSERTDRAVHGRAESGRDREEFKNKETKSSNSSRSDECHQTASQVHEVRGFKEKSDRAVHGRYGVSGDGPKSDSELNPPATEARSKDEKTTSRGGPSTNIFDLVGSNGDLLVDVGINKVNGFSIIFSAGEKVPLTKSLTFSTVKDYQRNITFKIALRFGQDQIIKVDQFEISGIPPASRGIPKISVVIEIRQGALEISAFDSSSGNLLQIFKQS
jgi:hypothetical protein